MAQQQQQQKNGSRTCSVSKGKAKNPLKQKKFRHNWRTDMLAVPKGNLDLLDAFRMTKEAREAKESQASMKAAPSGTSLTAKKSKKVIPIEEDKKRLKRLEQMSLANERLYQVQKNLFGKQKGKKFESRMNDRMKRAHNTMYHQYELARVALKKKKKLQKQQRKASAKSWAKGKEKKKGKQKESRASEQSKAKKDQKPSYRMQARLRRMRPHEERLKEALEWCKTASLPKKLHPPPKINRGKIGDIAKIHDHLAKLAKPRHFYKRPSQDSMNIDNRNKVKRTALMYRITDNVDKLARPPVRFVTEPRPLGLVVPEALTAKPTPRILELAVPKPKAASTDSDYNEDAFKISPNALKYVATPRILELAKPKEFD